MEVPKTQSTALGEGTLGSYKVWSLRGLAATHRVVHHVGVSSRDPEKVDPLVYWGTIGVA